jgi:transcriptional regulator with GAF, ATPase, and Fis domain
VVQDLQGYDWPGNVRELQNLLERAVLATSDGVLRLQERLAATSWNGTVRDEPDAGRLATLAEMERQHIQAALRRSGDRVGGPGGAAEILDIHPNTLRSRMKKLGIAGPRASAELDQGSGIPDRPL